MLNFEFMPNIEISPKSQAAFLEHFNCSETSKPYLNFVRQLSILKMHLDNHKSSKSDTPSNEKEQLNDIGKAFKKVLKQIKALPHSQEVIQQNYLLELYGSVDAIPISERQNLLGTKFSDSTGMDQLDAISKALFESAAEIQTNGRKTVIKDETVKALYPYFEGADTNNLNYLLHISFEILGIESNGRFNDQILKARGKR